MKQPYREPAVVHLGGAEELIKLGINGDICDDNPCTGNWRYFYASEKDLAPEDIKPDHPHDPSKPLLNPERESKK